MSCNLLDTVLNLENQMLMWVWDGCNHIGYLLQWLHGWLEALAAQYHKRVLYCVSLAWKGIKVKIWSTIFAECISPLPHCKLKEL